MVTKATAAGTKDGNLFSVGIKDIRERGFTHFFWRLIHFALVHMNASSENLRYALGKAGKKERSADVLVNGLLMRVDLNDNGISKELYVNRKREHFSTEFMKTIVGDDDVVIDIGANIGYYALLEARLARDGAIFCIEPIPRNVELLKKNIALNKCNNALVFQSAIGAKNGTGTIYVYDKCNWCSFTKDPSGTIVDEIDVPIMTLDAFVESKVHQNPTFIRMDVEGYEYHVIKGASNLLKQKTPLKLFIEIHPHLMPPEQCAELIALIKEAHFRVRAIFFDPAPRDYKTLALMNALRRRLGLFEFGYVGNSYDALENALKTGCACEVFFER